MSPLAEVAQLFTKLGFTAFGGPAAHLALMEDETVRRRGWLDRQHFLDMVAAINFIPGPNSTQLAIHLGFLRAGYPGLLVAGVCFIAPAVLIILPLAWLYVTFGRTPQAQEALVGINACVVAIVAAALWRFVKTGVKDRFSACIAIATTLIGFLADPKVGGWLNRHQSFLAPIAHRLAGGKVDIIILACAALAGALWYGKPKMPTALPMLIPLMAMPADARWIKMALLFFKVGATLFGSGYVLISYLQSGLVDQYGWMTRKELLDAIAVGQFTPGPLLTTATFIGYFLGHAKFGGGIAGGIACGLLATLAIFLPSFVLIALLGPLLPRIRRNPIARGALNGMNAAVVSLILVVCIRLGFAALTDATTILVAAGTFMALLVWNVNSTWLILAAGVVGMVRTKIRY